MVQRSKLSNPEQFPPGALRDYMQLLHELWVGAGEPSSHELAGVLECSHTTVARLFKGLPSKKKRAYDLLGYLYEHPRGRRMHRSEEVLDEFFACIDTLMRSAESAAHVEEPAPAEFDAFVATPSGLLHLGEGEEEWPYDTIVADHAADDVWEDIAGEGQLSALQLREFMSVVGPGYPVFGDNRLLRNIDRVMLAVGREGALEETALHHSVYSVDAVGAPYSQRQRDRFLPDVEVGLYAFYGFKEARLDVRGVSLIHRVPDGEVVECFPRFRQDLGFNFRRAVILLIGETWSDKPLETFRQMERDLMEGLDESEALVLEFLGPPQQLPETVKALSRAQGPQLPLEWLVSAVGELPGFKRATVLKGEDLRDRL